MRVQLHMRLATAPRQANPAEQGDQCEDLMTRINEHTSEVLLWVRVDGVTRRGHRIRVCVKLPNLAVAEAVLQEGRDGIMVESHAVQDIHASCDGAQREMALVACKLADEWVVQENDAKGDPNVLEAIRRVLILDSGYQADPASLEVETHNQEPKMSGKMWAISTIWLRVERTREGQDGSLRGMRHAENQRPTKMVEARGRDGQVQQGL